MTTVLFWDIDGTLLNSAGAGRLALTEALSEMKGIPMDVLTLEMAGMTDWGIVTSILKSCEISPSPENIRKLLSLYQKYLPDSLCRSQGYVLEGVREILEVLKPYNTVVSFLLTGNIEPGAWKKLAHYQLDSYFTSGAFCQSSSNRNDIARDGLALAQQQVGKIRPEQCYVIGDTPNDIRCGQSIGARTVAIASTRYSVQDLVAHNSDFVWDSFPEPHIFLQQLGI